MEIIKIPISDLTPDPNNAKDHPDWQVEQIKASIQQFGNLDPIGVWGDNNMIVEGHGRYEALKDLGYTEAECIRLDWLTDEERRAYALAHNKLTMNSGFDLDELNFNLGQITEIDMSMFGFDLLEAFEADNEVFEDELPDEVEPRCKRNDLWILGGHRLLCGDSTDPLCVDRLMDGHEADMVCTDPPYNMKYEGAGNTKDRASKRILNDNMPEDQFAQFLHDMYVSYYISMKDGASIYVFYKELGSGVFIREMREAGLTYKQELIWVKNQIVIGGSKYQSMYEPCLFGCKGRSIKKWHGKRKQRNVIESLDFMTEEELRDAIKSFLADVGDVDVIRERKQLVNDLHPTMKPIRLLSKMILNSSDKGDIVTDFFGGSGSTLIACEQLNRKCYMMELDPHYCDVIIQRWENLTGQKAVLENDER